MKLQFLGAAQTVTGSKYLLTIGQTTLLIDCGLFQGYKNLRLKNWDAFPFDVTKIDALLLTHAHLDHSGYIPVLIKKGFKGKVYCTSATQELCSILLADSGYLQEEEARFANKHGFSKHKPALPLYTEKEGEQAMDYFVSVPWKTRVSLSAGSSEQEVSFEFHPSGHLFGAASILIRAGAKSIAFSGDLGRTIDPLTKAPDFSVGADTLVVESTYGNRKHIETDPKEQLKDVIVKTAKRNGVIVIPAFAVGRAQLILYYIHQLKKEKAIPDLPVYLNSPMALEANQVFLKDIDSSKVSFEEATAICKTAKTIGSVEESMALNEKPGPMIIIAASGMATGGRVIHHLKKFAPDPKNTILFVGFQAAGTRGQAILNGAEEIKIHGEYWPVKAEVAQIEAMSAHADAEEILTWIRQLKKTPKKIFVTHGEPAAADELRRRIEEQVKVEALVPEHGSVFEL